MPKTLNGLLLAAILAMASCGCATCGLAMSPCTPGDKRPLVYGGVRWDAGLLFRTRADQDYPDTLADGVGLVAFALADLPLSAVADTLLLPATIPAAYERWRADSRKEASECGLGEGGTEGVGSSGASYPLSRSD
jgi:uncharacterized protein YceK